MKAPAERLDEASWVLDDMRDVALGKIEATPARVQAMRCFADRVYGLPKQQSEVTGNQTFIIATGVPRAGRD